MTVHEDLLKKMYDILHKRYGARVDDFLFPPPIFELMQAELLKIDLDEGIVETRFPVLPEHQNPYKTMQGGMIAAAADNTIGPLSILIAPANVTRTLEMKYSRAITLDMKAIIVTARLVERDEKRLFIHAEVRSTDGIKLATAKAVHWIVAEQ